MGKKAVTSDQYALIQLEKLVEAGHWLFLLGVTSDRPGLAGYQQYLYI